MFPFASPNYRHRSYLGRQSLSCFGPQSNQTQPAIEIIADYVEQEQRVLRARWTIEAEQDLAAMHSITAVSNLTDNLVLDWAINGRTGFAVSRMLKLLGSVVGRERRSRLP